MSNITYIIDSASLGKYKQLAKKIRKVSGIPLHEALEQVAQKVGLPTWHHVVESAKVTNLTERAYYDGLILGMDLRDGLDFNPGDAFVEDHQASMFCGEDLKEAYISGCEEEGEPATAEDIDLFMRESVDEYMFFRYTGDSLPKTIKEVLKLVEAHSFWPPQFVWLRGGLVDTYEAPAVDSEGQVAGVRFKFF